MYLLDSTTRGARYDETADMELKQCDSVDYLYHVEIVAACRQYGHCILSTADLHSYSELEMAATVHARASSGSRWRSIASMQDLLRRQLVHPDRRTSLHLCVGTSGNGQQWEVGAEMPRRHSLDCDQGRSCLCNTADLQVTCLLRGLALQ